MVTLLPLEFYLRKLATRFYFCLCTYRAENYIDGKEFAKLTESEVRDMVPPIGLAKKIIRLIPKVTRYCYTSCTPVWVSYFNGGIGEEVIS